MCTAFIKNGDDLLYGYNLDIDPAVWNYSLIIKKNIFSVGIKVGKTLYYTHGVNSCGNFGNLPYMNGETGTSTRDKDIYRIDLLVDRYIKNKISYGDITEIINTKKVINLPNVSLHSLIGDKNGNILLIEPDYGYKKNEKNYAVASNFPIIPTLDDYTNPFYGKDRYDKATEILEKSDNTFSVYDGLKLLKEVSQTGQWGTRISFVYSRNKNAVYYCFDGNFDEIKIKSFL